MNKMKRLTGKKILLMAECSVHLVLQKRKKRRQRGIR